MKNIYIFLRHGETLKDPDLHPSDWKLTYGALEKLQHKIDKSEFVDVTKIFSSTEPKSIATAKPIATLLDLPIDTMEEFVEMKREKKFLTDEEFLLQKRAELERRDEKVNGVESGNEALTRFKSGIEKLESEYAGENILVVTHGTVLTLYFADLLGPTALQNIFARFQKLHFCATGKVENGSITKDII